MAANQAHRDDNLLEDIQSRLETLNKSERKVAEAILRDPSAATRYSIAALARAADVSAVARVSSVVSATRRRYLWFNPQRSNNLAEKVIWSSVTFRSHSLNVFSAAFEKFPVRRGLRGVNCQPDSSSVCTRPDRLTCGPAHVIRAMA